ncbi:MAG: hypothetical protein KGN16_26000 [Burkholderiales bacterium]|nr:hypothetical protein [Burkholderiales bacterium]
MTPSKASTGLQFRFLIKGSGELELSLARVACQHSREVSLAEALHLDNIAAYSKRSTGGKYQISPSRNLGS